jgi:hypothetical protein
MAKHFSQASRTVCIVYWQLLLLLLLDVATSTCAKSSVANGSQPACLLPCHGRAKV